MKFSQTRIPGLLLIEPTLNEDNRGIFARTFCEETFHSHELQAKFAQCSTSGNKKRGTLRGLHFQIKPHEEVKVVRCTRGKIFDVIVDARPDSSTYLKWESFELSADNRKSLYIPTGCAHGFQTLEDNSEVFYMISSEFHSDSARGLRWNDRKLDIKWPLSEITISERDQQWPLL